MVGSLVSGSSSATSVVGNGDNGSNGAVAKVDDTSVRVALRIRPPLPRELINNCQTCITVTPGLPQVWMGKNSAFTYDYVFDQNIDQETVFGQVRSLIEGCLEGFNATILAYGQTGSGKTYTMGTGFDIENIDAGNSQSQGIVPRAVHYLFECIDMRKNAPEYEIKPTFKISIQFIELYNEEIIDLVDGQQSNKIKRGGPPMSANQVKIHEDANGGIYLVGVGTQTVHSAEDTLKCLRLGALGRTTASTNMNDQSSRSHAIFSMHIEQTRIIAEQETGGPPDFETLTAKFHFVDLAGSERLKRTGAVGDRQKEGISINCGLLALGNVISALGDKAKKALHVPYRDSKLTRLLQDSLGGNSRTIMIACVSPCDVDFLETLNTLKYANRARNIKNKVTINQDKSSRLIADLKDRIRELEDELLEYKQGKRTIDPLTGEEIESDTYQETKLLQSELNALKSRNESLQSTVDTLTSKNTQLLADRTLSSLNGTATPEMTDLVQNYTKEIEQLSTKLIESEYENDRLKRKLETAKTSTLMNSSFSPRTAVAGIGSRPSTAVHNTSGGETSSADILEAARRELEKEKDALKRLKRSNDKPNKGELKGKSSSDDEEENDENEEEDGSASDEEDSESEENDENYSQLVSLNDDITMKQKLIEQLESTQRRMDVMARNYEEKLNCLAKKISATEDERDKVMKSNHPAPKLNQIKVDYEKKLSEMQNELKKWQQAHRSHQKLIKDHNDKCKHLEHLKNDLEKMKQNKVKLMNQLKADAVRFRNLQTARANEIAQLKKEQRKKDNVIRQLTSEKNQKEGILKRKHEEINYLKNKMRAPVAARPNSKNFSPLKAKQNWLALQSKMMKSLEENQKLESYESEMMTVIEERKKLNVELEEYRIALRTATSAEEKNKIIDQMDTVSKSLEYAEGRIGELQGEMLCYSTNNNDEDIGLLDGLVQKLNKEECTYIMKKMYEYCRENIGSSKQHEKRVELLEKAHQKVIADLDIVRELYRHLYTEGSNNRELFLPPDSLADFGSSTHASRRDSKPMESSTSYNQPLDQKARKARRLTATPDQLLGTSSTASQSRTFLVPGVPRPARLDAQPIEPRPIRLDVQPIEPRPTSSTAAKDPEFVHPTEVTFIRRRIESRTKAKAEREKSANETKPSENPIIIPPDVRLERRNTYTIDDDHSHPLLPFPFPEPDTRHPSNGNDEDFEQTFVVTPKGDRNSDEDMDIPETSIFDPSSPLNSPLPSRRLTLPHAPTITNNVFQRLTSQTALDGPITSKGKIVPLRPKLGIIYNTHIAHGHSKSVLSICATDDRLYSGGVDTTIKMWDLNVRQEIQTLVGSPGNIAAIRCSSNENFIFAASSYCVKIWDRRADSRCIKTLTSAGTVQDDAPYRPLTALAQGSVTAIPTSEQQIQALALSSNNLFTSYGDRVRAWDIRQFKPLGLLSGRHQSNIMCLEVNQSKNYETTLVTGSKDHRIKVYNLGSNATMLSNPPTLMLEPPHYDGIQALLLSDNVLFSGSRDTCIKKWDLNLTLGTYTVQAKNNAHTNWVTGLAFAPMTDKHIISVSRDGYMKLWSVDEGPCYEVGKFEVNKGKSVECIASNSTHIFTGSSDGAIGFWKFRSEELLGQFATPPPRRTEVVDDPNYEDEC